jgi:hypothetical protein
MGALFPETRSGRLHDRMSQNWTNGTATNLQSRTTEPIILIGSGLSSRTRHSGFPLIFDGNALAHRKNKRQFFYSLFLSDRPLAFPQVLIKGIMSTSLDFRMGFYYSFDPSNDEFCRPFPLQTVCICCMIVMPPNNRRDDPVLAR